MADASLSDYVTTLGNVQSLWKAGQWADAETLVTVALARWPDDETFLVQRGFISQAQQHWPEAIERFAHVRERYPGQVLGWSRGGEALRWARRLEEADEILSSAISRFPVNEEVLAQWVLVACDRADWEVAEARGHTMLSRLPNVPASYLYAAEPPARRGRSTEAELTVAEGLHRLGLVAPLVLRFAELASAREDWPSAARRWEAVLHQFPALEAAHRGYANALRQLDQLVELEAVLSAARVRFPASLPLAIEHAWVATARERWSEALARWQRLAAEVPDNPTIRQGLLHAQLRAGERRPAAPSVPSAPNAAKAMTILADAAKLMLCFESLGQNCEFGVVQRQLRAEPLGLLRFADITFDNLLAALDSDLAGIGAEQFTHASLRDGVEYMTYDTRYGLRMHSFTGPTQVSLERFRRTANRHLQFLARKLLEDLGEPSKIFVRTSSPDSQTPDRIMRLHGALCRHGPATLLFVQTTDEPARIGRAEWFAPGVLLGWIERFDVGSVLTRQWLAVCRSAYALWVAQQRAMAAPRADVMLARAGALREAGVLDEAEAVLAEGVATYPQDERLLLAWCRSSEDRQRWAEAAERWALQRARHPENGGGWVRGCIALLLLGRLADADALIADGERRFPKDKDVLIQWVLCASAQTDWDAAQARGAECMARLPEAWEAYGTAADVLTRAGCHEQADAIVAAGLARASEPAPLRVRGAELAAARADWEVAALRWRDVLREDPQLAVARRGQVEAERKTAVLDRVGLPARPRLVRDRGTHQHTLAFCTSYVGAHLAPTDTWEQRYAMWRRTIVSYRIRCDQVLIIDDGSPSLPDWRDVDVLHEGDARRSLAPAVLFRFARHLGRRGVSNFPGWVRSFFHAARYAEQNGFEKVIHIESDAFLTSDRMQAFVDEISDGWVAPWCPRWRRPESAIQIMAGAGLSAFAEFAHRDVDDLAEAVIENELPFTWIEGSFRGDRFCEYMDHVPRDADWSAQTAPPIGVSWEDFYWWHASAGQPAKQ
jgi:tetratricopeptide (TPR) repeat protein